MVEQQTPSQQIEAARQQFADIWKQKPDLTAEEFARQMNELRESLPALPELQDLRTSIDSLVPPVVSQTTEASPQAEDGFESDDEGVPTPASPLSESSPLPFIGEENNPPSTPETLPEQPSVAEEQEDHLPFPDDEVFAKPSGEGGTPSKAEEVAPKPKTAEESDAGNQKTEVENPEEARTEEPQLEEETSLPDYMTQPLKGFAAAGGLLERIVNNWQADNIARGKVVDRLEEIQSFLETRGVSDRIAQGLLPRVRSELAELKLVQEVTEKLGDLPEFMTMELETPADAAAIFDDLMDNRENIPVELRQKKLEQMVALFDAAEGRKEILAEWLDAVGEQIREELEATKQEGLAQKEVTLEKVSAEVTPEVFAFLEKWGLTAEEIYAAIKLKDGGFPLTALVEGFDKIQRGEPAFQDDSEGQSQPPGGEAPPSSPNQTRTELITGRRGASGANWTETVSTGSSAAAKKPEPATQVNPAGEPPETPPAAPKLGDTLPLEPVNPKEESEPKPEPEAEVPPTRWDSFREAKRGLWKIRFRLLQRSGQRALDSLRNMSPVGKPSEEARENLKGYSEVTKLFQRAEFPLRYERNLRGAIEDELNETKFGLLPTQRLSGERSALIIFAHFFKNYLKTVKNKDIELDPRFAMPEADKAKLEQKAKYLMDIYSANLGVNKDMIDQYFDPVQRSFYEWFFSKGGAFNGTQKNGPEKAHGTTRVKGIRPGATTDEHGHAGDAAHSSTEVKKAKPEESQAKPQEEDAADEEDPNQQVF